MNNEVVLRFTNTTTELNFDLNIFTQESLVFKTLLDFIETDTVGDVFIGE